MPELFNFFTTGFLALWLVSILFGQTSLRGEVSFIVFIMLFMVFLPMGTFLYHTLVCGLSIALRYTQAQWSSTLLDVYFSNSLKKAMGHLLSPVGNILGVASWGSTHSPPPLFVKSSEKVTNSTRPSPFWNEKSSAFISWCSCQPRNPKCIVRSHQTVLMRDRGVWLPNWPFSGHSIFSSSLVRLWASFGRFPILSLRGFLAFPSKTFLDDRNSVSLTIDLG